MQKDLHVFQKQGFSVVELLTMVVIASVLVVIGVRSYQAQTNKARTLEAKHSLSYVFKAEEQFKKSWKTYHENLLAIGAIPDGSYHYDVGFKVAKAEMSKTDGDLGNYPLPESLNIKECTTFRLMCKKGECLSGIEDTVGDVFRAYFNPRDLSDPDHGKRDLYHSLIGSCKVKKPYVIGEPTDHTHVSLITENCGDDDYKGFTACEDKFKAVAIGKLKNVDIWTVNEKRIFQHVTDGTE